MTDGAIERHLMDRLTNRRLATPVFPRESSDRWLLASALQKSIRRGQRIEAVAAAASLVRVDRDYLWRRLRIIALEDVGTGNIEAVASVMAIAGKRAWRAVQGDHRLAAVLADLLAAGDKDRTACDLLCWALFSPSAVTRRNHLLTNPASWLPLAQNPEAPVWHRAIAVQLIAGFRTRDRQTCITVTRPQPVLFRELVESLELPSLAAYTTLKGGNTESLNTTLPLAALLLEERQRTAKPELATDSFETTQIGDFPAETFCQYTRIGRRALALLLAKDDGLRRAIANAGGRAASAVAGLLLFQVEGGLLNRYIDYAPEIRAESARAELAALAINSDAAGADLRSMMKERLPELHAARATAWAEYTRQSRVSETLDR